MITDETLNKMDQARLKEDEERSRAPKVLNKKEEKDAGLLLREADVLTYQAEALESLFGLAGEMDNKRLGLLVAASRLLDRPLSSVVRGPAGCGKSTLLRSFNRMNDFVEGVTIDGQLLYRNIDLHHPRVDPMEIRLKIGMVFQKPNPFPKSIYRNVAWGPKINGFSG